MNETTTTSSATSEQFTWRRMSETFKLFDTELPPFVWGVLLVVILAVALFYVMWMYLKDSSGRGSLVKAVFATGIAGAIIAPMYVLALLVLGDYDSSADLWSAIGIAVAGLVMGVVASFVVMALISGPRDGGVGPVWGTLLATLRLSVYTILMVIFLLPARQRSTTTKTESRVVVVMDVSDSMQTSDVQPEPEKKPPPVLVTRMELVLQMLQRDNGSFLTELLKKNPVSMYRLGSRLDSSRLMLTSEGMSLSSTEVGAGDTKGDLLGQKAPLSDKAWGLWLMPTKRLAPAEEEAINEAFTLSAARRAMGLAEKDVNDAEAGLERKKAEQRLDAKRKELDDLVAKVAKLKQKAPRDSAWVWGLSDEDLARHVEARLHKVNEKARDDRLGVGTNLGDSLLGVFNREGGNRLQGIVIVTDGRNTDGSQTAMRDLQSRAAAAKVPIFVVGVGEERRKVKIEIVDLRVPPVIQPEDKFRAVVEIIGEGLERENEKKLDVTLEITHTRPDKAFLAMKDAQGRVDRGLRGLDGLDAAKLKERTAERKLPDLRQQLAKLDLDIKTAPDGARKEELKDSRKKLRKRALDVMVAALEYAKPKDKDKDKPGAKDKDKPADKDKDKPVEKEKAAEDRTKTGAKEEDDEEELDIFLIERNNPDNPKPVSDLEKINLGKRLLLKPPGKSELDKSNPPRLEIEWALDAEELVKHVQPPLGAIDLSKYPGKKWELGETFEDSEMKFRVRVPADKRELQKEPHQSDKTGMKVIKRPVRVLLMASAANRDYQFVRTLLVREMSKKQLELAIHLQLPPGVTQYRPGVVQDVPPDRLLTEFPRTYNTMKGDLLDLSSYDVIVAFDADWLRLSPEQIKMINSWSIRGGGLVMIGGHINTVELVKPREELDKDRFKPLLDLLPVVLDDRRDFIERKTDDPWPLDLSDANPNTDFLRLDESPEAKFGEDWINFFYGEESKDRSKAIRGIFNFYPVQKVITGSAVMARFSDPEAKLKEDNKLHPYIVANDTQGNRGRVVWVGSAETWRLREYKESFHERFWTKLVKFAAANSKGTVVRPIRLEVGKHYLQNRDVEVVAKIEGPDAQPLSKSVTPLITLKLPPGADAKEIKQPVEMKHRPGTKDGWFSGRFRVRSPGEYEMTLTVPRQPGMDSAQSESAKFTVKESNPELDNTRPDYNAMYRLASEADEVINRMAEKDRPELKRRLERPVLRDSQEGDAGEEPLSDKQRLYFKLSDTELIPKCMMKDEQTQTSKGGTTDLWDDGLTVWTFDNKPGERERQPIKIAYVLLLVVGLLSTEWLIRKLLRLA